MTPILRENDPSVTETVIRLDLVWFIVVDTRLYEQFMENKAAKKKVQ